jgi:hypothetical protein
MNAYPGLPSLYIVLPISNPSYFSCSPPDQGHLFRETMILAVHFNLLVNEHGMLWQFPFTIPTWILSVALGKAP